MRGCSDMLTNCDSMYRRRSDRYRENWGLEGANRETSLLEQMLSKYTKHYQNWLNAHLSTVHSSGASRGRVCDQRGYPV